VRLKVSHVDLRALRVIWTLIGETRTASKIRCHWQIHRHSHRKIFLFVRWHLCASYTERHSC